MSFPVLGGGGSSGAIALVERRRLFGVLVLPAAGYVSCWLNAFLTERASPDQTIDGLTAHLGTGLSVPGENDALPAALALGWLRSAGVRRVTLAFPVPGDPCGLGGPQEFNQSATDVGQAVLFDAAGLGAVPDRPTAPAAWTVVTARPPSYLPDVASAHRELRGALLTAADELARLDVAAWAPELADELMNLRAPAGFEHPVRFADQAAAALAVQAARCLGIAELAKRDDGGSLSATQANARREALDPLSRAARTGVVAACSAG